jgi:hypothetical protein
MRKGKEREGKGGGGRGEGERVKREGGEREREKRGERKREREREERREEARARNLIICGFLQQSAVLSRKATSMASPYKRSLSASLPRANAQGSRNPKP